MSISIVRVLACVLTVGFLAGTANAVDIETVPVGNPGNAGELSGSGTGGYGPDRICGSIGYTYNIGKYEVTAGQYTAFLNAVAKMDTYALYNVNMWSSIYGCKIERWAGNGTSGNPYQYRVASDYANRPVNFVSWGDAARFSNWLHNGQPTGSQNGSTTEDGAYFLNGRMNEAELLLVKRNSNWKWAITNEDEWYKAAYHKNDGVTGNYFDYPTSNNLVPGRDLTDVSGNNANYYADGYLIDSPYYRTVVGEFQSSESPYGTYDQGGNVWELNESVLYGTYRGLRGGSFNYEDYFMLASYRNIGPPEEYFTSGFRVVAVAGPTCNTPKMDSNGDLHVDAIDFDAFSACYNGPTNLVSEDCLCLDSNADQYVDAIDFDTFSGCYNGPVNPPHCG